MLTFAVASSGPTRPAVQSHSVQSNGYHAAPRDPHAQNEQLHSRSSYIGLGAGLAAASSSIAVLSRPRRNLKKRAHRVQSTSRLTTKVKATNAEVPAGEVRDVAIVGAGPAGTLLAYLLAERHGLSVCLIDKRAQAPWPNNYGVWQEEWDALEAKLSLGLQECVNAQWPITDCYFGGSWDRPVEECLRLDRPYARVDRMALKGRLQSSKVEVIEETLDAQAVACNIYSGAGIQHTQTGSQLRFPSGKTRFAKMVVDCTGSESKLTVRRDPAGEQTSPEAGFQIAYGIECIVEGNTHYDPEAMTLFDYRTDHLRKVSGWEESASKSPTFMYAMPLGPAENGGYKIFYEETSLVARPAVSFEECRRRLYARLEHLGVTVREGSVSEEEYCYIPMGGALPTPGQRVVAYGGAAAMVHPSTGYQLCRMMAGAKEVADSLAASIKAEGTFDPNVAAAAAYGTVWSPGNIAQRDFAVFGGEFLMALDVEGLRGWFGGFFRLEEPLWAGFLAGWPTLPGNENHESWLRRITFGLQLVTKLPLPIILKLVGGIASFSLGYGPRLLRSVTPLFGEPPSYEWVPLNHLEVGDEAAKQEARAMMAKQTGAHHGDAASVSDAVQPKAKEKQSAEAMVGWGYN
mmetsp:Transcript_10804/g.24702  ORF Transcript_10804/g.24702 Transcript_10804/m.24702 type:complete len:630 (-) Transcript_10804:38-1927(-)|eukprot:CAMPEP_0178382076 /NCGR_PEP_ID=MMETSP0689_2-20121128/6310_1 /TAXON_ID=160604 /ORGANISM="Amphidinium massartii, Strain CS-259" /LENGTH=629 /DNA_ID=CAMNT_0020002275 /DNA_START=33 /DNA_END=1922 /DNA_ORIENTATION=-